VLDYPALAAVAAVIREGSFDRAAEALGITPSAVSQRVRGIEERLGAVLIVRGQPCEPTDLGRTLYAHFDRVQLLEADLAPSLTTTAAEVGTRLTLKIAVNADSLATWFLPAAAAFAEASGILLDITIEDEAHTADRLRSGEVVAAVTSDGEPVQGCKTIPLGALRYLACASPAFVDRHFEEGANAGSLAAAPYLRFDRRDKLQARWAQEAHGVDLSGTTHWVPSTQGFLDFALCGLAWGLQPAVLARPHLAAGRLVELPPEQPIDVSLYWTVTRLSSKALSALTEQVRALAGTMLRG
jgi:LysR family transcriptional regulator (chromosome initiation inhibitor)